MTNAGWGAAPEWLPPGVRRAQAQEDAAERREAKQAEQERADRAEDSRQRALALAAEQATARGEEISAMALARGEIRGRSVQDIFQGALAASGAEDRRDALRLQREGTGAPVHIEVGEAQIHHAPRSERAMTMFHASRRFWAARKATAAAAAATEASRNDWGIVASDVTDRTGFR